ncbi:MAG: hypothetical protein ACK4I8_03025, partial [Armatimonadota bacterium]
LVIGELTIVSACIPRPPSRVPRPNEFRLTGKFALRVSPTKKSFNSSRLKPLLQPFVATEVAPTASRFGRSLTLPLSAAQESSPPRAHNGVRQEHHPPRLR